MCVRERVCLYMHVNSGASISPNLHTHTRTHTHTHDLRFASMEAVELRHRGCRKAAEGRKGGRERREGGREDVGDE